MHIDVNVVPEFLDAYHVGLAGLVVGLLILQVALLTVAVIALLRSRKGEGEEQRAAGEPAIPVARAAEPPPIAVAPPPAQKPALKEATPESALQLLGLLQSEARFVDFVQENVGGFSDAEIGAAARVVHEGCRKVLRQHFELEPIRQEAENSRVTLPKGFDASRIRLTGNIVGEAPFTGTLVHRGWRVGKVKLPKVTEGHDISILAAAEVEL